MIDRKTGCITLSATRQLSAKDAFGEVSTLLLGEVQTVADMKTGWKWLTIKNLDVDGNYFILSLGFHTDRLETIELIVAKARFDLMANWDAWSEQRELDSLATLRNWIQKELGREGKFEWGEVRATYDPKGGSSSICIRYT